MSLLKTCLQVVSPHLYFFIMDGGEKRTTELLTCCWTACPPQWDTQTDRDRPVAVLQRCTCSISISTSSVTVHFSAHVTGSISQKPTVNPSPFPAGTYHVMSRHVMSGAGQRFEPRTVGSSLLTPVLCMGSAVSVYLRASVRRRLVSPGRFQCVSSCSCAGLLSLWSCWWTPADAQCWSISIHRLRCCCCCCCASFWIVPVEPQETVMLIKFSRNNNNSSSNTQKLQSAPDEKKMLLFRGQRKAPADGQIQASGRLHWRCRAPSCR